MERCVAKSNKRINRLEVVGNSMIIMIVDMGHHEVNGGDDDGNQTRRVILPMFTPLEGGPASLG